jgi:hypothetical protein
VAWDVKKFMDDYNKGECDNVRCRNRKDQAEETARELREAQALIRRIMARAKRDPDNGTARAIYAAIANYNVGNRDVAAQVADDPGPPTDLRIPD